MGTASHQTLSQHNKRVKGQVHETKQSQGITDMSGLHNPRLWYDICFIPDRKTVLSPGEKKCGLYHCNQNFRPIMISSRS